MDRWTFEQWVKNGPSLKMAFEHLDNVWQLMLGQQEESDFEPFEQRVKRLETDL